MSKLKNLVIATGLLVASSPALAITTVIDFHTLASGNEYGVTPLMFDTSGNVTTVVADSFLNITGTDGFAYLDNDPGLGVCANLNGDQCAPASDDNVSYHDAVYDNGDPNTGNLVTAAYAEVLHFVFDFDVTIDAIYFNNRHDGDRSLAGDSVLINGLSTALVGGGTGYYDSYLLNQGDHTGFDVGFDINSCETRNNCEFYVSKLVFSYPGTDKVPEPSILALLSLGLLGLGVARHRRQ